MNSQGGKSGDRPAGKEDAGDYPETVQLETLELVSTRRLTRLLAEQQGGRQAMHDIAESASEGYLARDAATGLFQVIDDDELQALLDRDVDTAKVSAPPQAPPAAATPGEDLSLVTTQALRKILATEEPAAAAKKPRQEPGGGFNPYDHG